MSIRYVSPTKANVDFPFRILQTVEQVNNIFKAAQTGSRIVPIMKTVHPVRQVAQYVFMLFNPSGGAWGFHEWYIADLDHLTSSGVDFGKYEVSGMEMMTVPDLSGKSDIASDHLPQFEEVVDDRTPEQRAEDFKTLLETTAIPMPEGTLIV